MPIMIKMNLTSVHFWTLYIFLANKFSVSQLAEHPTGNQEAGV